jgi:hypothetical protein
MPVILALRKLGLKDPEFKVNLNYIAKLLSQNKTNVRLWCFTPIILATWEA